MAFLNLRSLHVQYINNVNLFHFSVLLFILVPHVGSTSFSFNFTSSYQNSENQLNITYQGDSTWSNQGLQISSGKYNSSGRAVYFQPVILWNSASQEISDFTTHFSFSVQSFNSSKYGDGFSFFLSSYPSELPINSTNGCLGLLSRPCEFYSEGARVVAVEFDTFSNYWDPSSEHVGININSVVSVENVTWNTSIKDGVMGSAIVSYNSGMKNFSVILNYGRNQVLGLSHSVNLRDILPENISVGFSAATGGSTELLRILSWDFSSSMESKISIPSVYPSGNGKENHVGMLVGIVVGGGVLIGVLGLICFVFLKMIIKRKKEENIFTEYPMDSEFGKAKGPRRFSLVELATATSNFTEEGILGKGGFGKVYRGFLNDLKLSVAIKKFSKGSRQGEKEYISEVTIISQLRHRNLVRLIGWCHDHEEFLLVYELMPNGSLDSHLFRAGRALPWEVRYNIVLGLASALRYLHEECEHCILHRDIKTSNVLLDSSFNAKLGDFGLAKLMNHDSRPKTTVLAGTFGYMAPEYAYTGKPSKGSDVYSFGIVALEIACGRHPDQPAPESSKFLLVEWLWGLYGRRRILDAADERLNMEFNEEEMERLMVVGLWCAHPENYFRPSMSQVINVLKLEAPMPELPALMPAYTPILPSLSMDVSSGNYSTCACSPTSSQGIIFSSDSPSSAILWEHKARSSRRNI